MGLLSPSAGEIHYDGQRIDNLERKDSLPYRRKMQMIFQNPYASLNPRMTIQQTLEEPIRFHHPDWSPVQVRDKIHEVMHSVGIDPNWGSRFGHEFSGGQRQRIALARAMIMQPDVLVLDEPTDGLDPNQKELIRELVREMKVGRTIVLSTHILEEAEELCDRAVVINQGNIIEDAKIDHLVDQSGRLATRFRELTLGL